MAGTDKERDWDKEMAEVDRLLKKLPYAEPSLRTPTHGSDPTVKRAGVPHGTASHLEASGPGGGRLGTWIRVVLGVLVGIGVAPGVWPYTHGCGLRLIFYLTGVCTVIAAGLWSSVSSWKRRLGAAHVIAQALIIWGVLLLTGEILPRVSAHATAVWLCPDVPTRTR
ncbi:MAG TPA: hypothetical protein VFD76_05695 [Gemmatimonadales bacterium]|nr:hypothetical protein [Gemmatimonadales bacterium]